MTIKNLFKKKILVSKKESKEKKENSVFGSIMWKLMERAASLIVSFVVTMVLSRLLVPKDFGVVAIVAVFVNISTVFVTSGLGNALIQKENADALDFSTLFWVNNIFSLMLYMILFVASPFIAEYFHHEDLIWLLRVQSITILIYGVNAIQTAYISRNMLFRFYFFSTLTGKVSSGILGIIFAFTGFGAWALVIQSVSLAAFETLVLWFKAGWRPKWQFSFERAKTLYSFSWRIMVTSLIVQFNDQLRNLIIGRKYSSEDIAYFDKGWLLPNTIITNTINAMSAVMFPVFSRTQENIDKLREKMRQWISLYAFVFLPILFFLAIHAKDITIIVFSKQWISSVPFLIMACIVYGTRFIEVPIREAIKSIGRVDIVLTMQIIKTIIAVVTLIIAMNFGVYAIGVNAAVCAIINIGISIFYARRLRGYKIHMVIEDVFITFLGCLEIGVIAFIVKQTGINIYMQMIVQIIVGALGYLSLAIVTKSKNYLYCKEIINSKFIKRKEI